ncbi:MAG: hypothetical protein HY707_12385 [Ignavibacteriae bacterium]|nr:hypothetical protein [Ignavibacteriota bacterium]
MYLFLLHNKMLSRPLVYILAASVILEDFAFSQSEPFKINGQLSISTESYSSNGIQARRTKSLIRTNFRSTITLWDKVTIPIDILLFSKGQPFSQPFNLYSMSPQLFGWLTLHGGYLSTRLSDLTFGDTRFLGGGFDARPGKFRLSVFSGQSQRAVATDTANGTRGKYRRMLIGGKLGYGTDDGFFIDLNFLRAADDSNSLNNAPIDVAPKENAVVSLAFGLPLVDKKLKCSGEVSLAALTNDLRAEETDAVGGMLRSIFTPHSSSQIDGAARLTVNVISSQTFAVGLNARWIGPGYVSLGYAQLPNDVLDATLSPALRLFDNKLSLKSSFGLRYNNLRNNRLATTRRIIGSVSTTIQPTPMFGADLQYSNYGMRSRPKNDTLSVDNLTQSLSISPRYTLDSFGGTSTLMATLYVQGFSDNNRMRSGNNDNTTKSLMTAWSLVLPSTLMLTTTIAYTSSETPTVTTTIKNFSETVGYRFFDNKLSTSLTVGYNLITTYSSDNQLNGRVNASYRIERWGTISMNLFANSYAYRESSQATSFNELQGILTYNVSF